VVIGGCFSGVVGRESLYFLLKNHMMNGDRYVTVLDDHLFNFYKLHGCATFMHDATPCHKAEKSINSFMIVK
jgi:hypothetical protein